MYLDVCAGVRSAKLLTVFHLGVSHVVSGLIRKMKEQRCKLHPSNAQGFVTFFLSGVVKFVHGLFLLLLSNW